MSRNIYTSKYRPKTLDDVVGQERIVKQLRRYVEAKHIPHLGFEGGPGIGKTTCALALARDLYGNEMNVNLLQINASDESGVDNIRKKVKGFCKMAPIEADFKIVFLDEVDYISQQSQAVLRRVMEDYSKITRFILSYNFAFKIISPIKDRMTIYRFGGLSNDEIISVLKRVDEVKMDRDTMELIAKHSRGSMRKALNILEDLSIGRDAISYDDAKDIVVSILKRDDIEVLVELIGKKNIRGLHEKTYELTVEKAIPPQEVLHELMESVEESELSGEKKMKMAWEIGETDWRISQGANPSIQLSCGFRRMMEIL